MNLVKTLLILISLYCFSRAGEINDAFIVADSLADNFNFTEAIKEGEKALENVLSSAGENDSMVATAYHKLGVYFLRNGDLGEAERSFNKAMEIREYVFGSESSAYALSLEGVASVYEAKGKYPQAKFNFKEVLRIRENIPDLPSDDLAKAWINLVEIALWERKYVEAESLCFRALRIMESDSNQNNPIMGSIYHDMGQALKAQKKYDHAIEYYEKAIKIYGKKGKKYKLSLSFSLNNIGVVYSQKEEFEKAIPYFKRSIEAIKGLLGVSHPSLIPGLCNLGDIYDTHLKDFYQADSLYKDAYRIAAINYSENHPFICRILKQHSYIALNTHDTSRALDMWAKAYDINHKYFNDIGYYQSEKDALHNQKIFRRFIDDYLSFLLDIGIDFEEPAAYLISLILTCKGSLSDIIFQRRKLLIDEKDPEISRLFSQLKTYKIALSKLYTAKPDEIDSLSLLIDKAETELAHKSASFRKYSESSDIKYRSFLSLLPENSVLLEYFKYYYYDDSLDKYIPSYMLLALKSTGDARISNLGSSSEIHKSLAQYVEHIRRVASQSHSPLENDETEYVILAKRLYEMLISPVDDCIDESDLVFIAPDGGLNLISFSGLVDNNGKYLVEKIPIHYLSAGRDLIRLKDYIKPNHGLLALANPDFNNADVSGDSYAEIPSGKTENLRSGCGELKDIVIYPIPETQKEVESIVSYWQRAMPEPALAYFGAEATEDNIKALAPNYRVIHLATHGYYLQGICRGSGGKTKPDENPLLQSGLFFAGANQHGRMADNLGIDDGILTAYEVSAMDLTGTDLVVLSACETGLGKVEQGEGVYGLRRAFQMAGVRTVVSALWSVPDKATSKMMAGLYSQSNKPLPERIRDMQLAQIKKLRAEGFSDHPYTWAGFIALGDWR